MPNTKRKAVLPLDNPPPVGSVWEQIELARIELGWSARELDKRANRTANHYSTIARNGWRSTEEVRLQIISALVSAGIAEERFYSPQAAQRLSAKLNGKLSAVRDILYRRHPHHVVDKVIANSEFIDAVPVNELSAFDLLDQEIRAAQIAPLGRMGDGDGSTSSAERERFERDAGNLGDGASGRRRKQARK